MHRVICSRRRDSLGHPRANQRLATPCKPKSETIREHKTEDEELASSLHNAGRTLVSLIGENGGLRAVRLEDIRPFDGNIIEEDLEEQPKAIRTQLDEVRMAENPVIVH